jgi:hypothetical protein
MSAHNISAVLWVAIYHPMVAFSKFRGTVIDKLPTEESPSANALEKDLSLGRPSDNESSPFLFTPVFVSTRMFL